MFSHFRPIFVCFLSLMLGIWMAELFREGKTVYFIVLLCFFVGVLLISFLKFAKKSAFLEKLWKFNKFLAVMFVSVLVGFGGFLLQINSISNENNVNFNTSENFVITGKLKDCAVIYSTEATFFLSDVFVSGEGKAYKLEKDVYVKMEKELDDKVPSLRDASIGDRISFVGTMNTTEVAGSNGVFIFAYKNNTRYIAKTNTAKLKNITEEETNLNFFTQTRMLIKDTIYKNMDERNAGLSYAVFVGDLSGVDYEIVSNFRATGVAHLLAVSGLNTSLMAIVLVWILNKCRVKKKYSILIVFMLLLFYCVICNFCASCLRASLMSVLFLVAQAFGKQNDSLNSISLSGIILLLICPILLFDLSFVLSYACVFGMVMLGPVFYKFFMKCRLGKFVSMNLAISLAAQIATLVLCVNAFGYVSIVALLVNLLVCPIMEYVYIASFVSLLITLIMPFMGFLLWCCQWGLWLVDAITKFVASFSFSVVYLDKISWAFLIWTFIATYIYSGFMIEKNKKKRALIYSGTAVAGAMILCFSLL